jgi:hemerythrin-like domain-containing protein
MPEDTPVDVRDPYAALAREHQLIERGLNVLGRICDESRRANALDLADAAQVIQFLRDFADRTHHLKEDDCLANVVRRAFSSEDCERLTREFDEMERREIGERAFERFAAIVEALEAKYADSTPLT